MIITKYIQNKIYYVLLNIKNNYKIIKLKKQTNNIFIK